MLRHIQWYNIYDVVICYWFTLHIMINDWLGCNVMALDVQRTFLRFYFVIINYVVNDSDARKTCFHDINKEQ